MPARRPTPTGLARAALRRLPDPVRRPVVRAATRAARRAAAEDAVARVSLVVLCERVDLPRLAETLEAVAAESPREILVVPVGPDPAAEVDRVVAGLADARVRVLAPAPTWQDAAAAGADAARGEFLQLLRACDPRVPGALAALADSLAASGSDLATGAVSQRGRPAPWLQRSTRLAHARPGRGVPPSARPELAGDLGLGNKLLRTTTWRAAGRRLGPLDGWLLSPTLAAHLAAADRVDVLGRPVQEHLGGHGVRAYGAAPDHLRDLGCWDTRAQEVERLLAGSGLEPGWRRHVLDVALPGFLLDTERATSEDWQRLRQVLARHAPGATGTTGTTGVGEGPGVEARTLEWLCAEDRRADVERLAVALTDLDGQVPTRLTRTGEVQAAWPELPPDVPAEVRRLTEVETPLVASVVRVVGHAESALVDTPRHAESALVDAPGRRVDLHLRVAQVDLPPTGVEVTGALSDGTPVAVQAGPDPAADRWAASPFARALAASARVPADAASLRLTLALAAGLSRTVEVRLADPRRRHPDPDPRVLVRDVRLEDEDLVVDLEGEGALTLVDEDDRELGTATAARPRITLRHPHFGRDRLLPTGHYRLVVDGRPPRMAEALVDRIPAEQVGRHHRLRTLLGPAGGLLLHLGPPLADDELGRHAQARLVAAYAGDERPVDPGVFYFESYVGRSASDSPRDIHDELRRRRPDVTTYWAVADSSVPAPPGARPVLLRSREWYDVLARAGCLVVNTDVEAWFRRRPGQFLLQTFHGYPSKGMGLGQWRAAGLPASRIRELRARGVDTWSAILTPTPEMTRHYREQYAYTGPAFEHGYPRNDALVGPGAADRRRRTRELLGLAEHQVAVLYAPTWRENLATRPRRAELTTHLDVHAAARALGDDHVLLLRGHRFHQRRQGAPGVVDVTDHPEINDLILASDVAVLDYSSLRFDFALTGRPMVFLVPDLEEYDAGSRSFLFPFAESAPGPFVRDTGEVVARVRDLPALRQQYAPAIVAFNATYNRWHDGHAAERVVDQLLAALAAPPSSPGPGAR
ncbi:CDP-glycerol glycerophosphotransferase family protein [Nocardioides panaciterrulae]|uniref:CDP-glycerol glycerophosphotransferase (TagB/SpsB family) n=1 Tax=Nocardioides panaciterrulae TaxID=661492 RepID=A0A7Y9E9R9_9ACTN|nr:CDP-glycerol glycerophosphotransferase family protein [Nocardioides panaciterrulae]NYD43546.1 CDP-glycerol glycerophosphotransferase (TagB/SpsB family) [Nocardioides panaciterrulae]